MPDAKRDLQLTLKFDANTQAGSRALAALAADLAKVEQAAGRAQKALGGTGAGAGGQALASGGAASAGGAGGGRPDAAGAALLDKMDRLTAAIKDLSVAVKGQHAHQDFSIGGGGGGGGKEKDKDKGHEHEHGFSGAAALTQVTAVIGTIGFLAQTAANLSDATAQLNHEWLTTNERTLAFAKAIPLVGDHIAGMMTSVQKALDRLDNPAAAEALARKRWYNPIEEAQMGATSAANMRAFGLARPVDSAFRNAEAVAAFPSLGASLASGGANDLGRSLFTEGGLSRSNAVGTAFNALVGKGALDGQGQLAAWRPPGVDPDKWRLGEANPITESMAAIQAARREHAKAKADANDSAEGVAGAQKRYKEARAAADAANAKLEAERHAAGIRGPGERAPDIGERLAAAAGTARPLAEAGVPRWAAGLAGAGAWLFPSSTAPRGSRPPVGAPGSDAALMNAHLDARKAELKAAQELNELEQKMADNKEKQIAALQKGNALRQAETGLIKTQLSLLDQERETVKGAGRQFAGMDKIGQASLYSAAERFKKSGRKAVTAEELGMLRGNALTADMVNQQLDKDARDDPNFKKLRELVGARDLDTIEAERKKVKADLDLKIQLDEEQFAKLMAEKLKDLNLKDMLGEIVKNSLEAKLRAIGMDAERGRVDRAAP